MAFTKVQLGIISDLLWAKYADVIRRGLLERRGLEDWERRLRDKYEAAAMEADRQWDQLRPVVTEAMKRWEYPGTGGHHD